MLWTRYGAALLAVVLVDIGIGTARAQAPSEIEALRTQAAQLFSEGKYTEALATQRTVAASIETAETAEAGAPARKTAETLTNVAWYALFSRETTESLAASDRARGLAPEILTIETNRAHALLFLDRPSDAREVYLAHKGKRLHPSSDKTWEDVIAEDFDALAAAGIGHSAFADILAALGIPNAALNNDISAIQSELAQRYAAGRYAEAVTAAERYVELTRERYGSARSEFATALTWLGVCREKTGASSEAEMLYRRALGILEQALGPDHSDVGTVLNNLARLYQNEGRSAEAAALSELGGAILDLSDRRKALGPGHSGIAGALNNLAGLYRAQGRFAEAEPLYQRSLAMYEKAVGAEHQYVGTVLNNLARLYQDQGRYAEAERYFKRNLDIAEKAFGAGHRDVGTALNNLAEIYRVQRRYAEAEPLFRRSLDITEKAFGADALEVSFAVNNLALVYGAQERYAQAEPLFQRSLAIRERTLGSDHPHVGTALHNLAELYQVQGRYAEAEPLFNRTIAITQTTLGTDHPRVATSLTGLAELYQDQGHYAKADALLKRSLAIREKVLDADHPDVARSFNNLAWLAVARGDWALAVDGWRRSTGIIQRRARRGLAGSAESSVKGEVRRLSWHFAGLIKVMHRLPAKDHAEREAQLQETFETAQWAQGSEAAASLAQMAARSAKGSSELAALVRERQDLVSESQAKEKLLIATKSEEPAKRNATVEKALSDRLAAIDKRSAAIDERLAKDFPDYAALASPGSLDIPEVQGNLGADEALVLFLDTPAWNLQASNSLPEETFVWVVTKTALRWVRAELGTAALIREVAAVRCGLERAVWEGDSGSQCAGFLNVSPNEVLKGDKPLPFDVARAHALYKALFGQVEDLIRGKHLLIVPSGPLTQLPFQVLVTDGVRPKRGARYPASAAELRRVLWLARQHAITVLPAVSSLKALRRVTRPSAATRPMIGFGNPLLDGDPRVRWEAIQVKLSREKQACRPMLWPVASVDKRRSVERVSMRGGHADLDHLRFQAPLPETADELCTVARDLRLEPDDILLGAKATETNIKQLSSDGKLSAYRVVHFATHGTVAGEIEGTTEPGLILTPPETATDLDDGYLSASEVAALKLDADWVVLSACNTAAGGAQGAEALSGLARAFIYAGTRSLLVSHWAVPSAATAKLVSTAVGATARDKKLGRAEALRRAMLAMIDKGEPHEAHPTYWAPFILVGEGAAVR